MRSLLALLAVFTLSTSTALTAVACGNSEQTTAVIFDWNDVINGEHNRTSDDFFKYLLNNPEAGIGQTLYKDIVDYISLSILKTNKTFDDDYQFAKQSVKNQIKNIQDSLRAKYGRNWEKEWKNFLKDPTQGGDGKTGSYQRYFDVLLKSKANTIVNQYYVGDNYHNYQYYSSTEISIWLNDIYTNVKPENKTMAQYLDKGLYRDKVWIVANSVSQNDNSEFQKLEETIKSAQSASSIKLSFKVAKTKNNQPLKPGDDYLVDPSNTIKGLLSNQQAKIAQVWMRNQGPIWTRQIVIPFNNNVKDKALQVAINKEQFSDSETKLRTVINNITNYGFEEAIKSEMKNIDSVSSSSSTGDLGLVTLNGNTSNIKASFSYYLYRYVTSAQGIGQSSPTTALHNLPEFQNNGSTPDFEQLFNKINRTAYTETDNHTSRYNDLAWIKDGDSIKKYSGQGEDKVAIFIDADGIHFIQTPGITYTSTVTNEPLQKIITDYTQLLSDTTRKATWEDVRKLSDRLGGLTNNPYLNFLQTQYLLWNARNEKTYFDLNKSLNEFTSGSSDIASDVWWDYILYFNNNLDKINWNLPSLLNFDIDGPKDKIYHFISLMKGWFQNTFARRWNLHQGITNTETLVKNINELNKVWDGFTEDAPIARLDADDIKSYLNTVAAQTIWWYDPNRIQN
ncbi:MAG: hypothetical protein ACRC8P_01815 [Spiroplasma sp.]